MRRVFRSLLKLVRSILQHVWGLVPGLIVHHLHNSLTQWSAHRCFIFSEERLKKLDSNHRQLDFPAPNNCYVIVTRVLRKCYPLCQDGEYRFIIFIPFPLFSKNFLNRQFTNLYTRVLQNYQQEIFHYTQFRKVFSGIFFVIHNTCEQRIMIKYLAWLRKTEDADGR